MKKTVFILAILSLIYLPAFSQADGLLKLNNPVGRLKVYHPGNPFYQPRTFDFRSLLADSLYNGKIFIPRIPDTKLYLGRIPFREPNFGYYRHIIHTMPIKIPESINDPMKIYKPDSRERYTLLITDLSENKVQNRMSFTSF